MIIINIVTLEILFMHLSPLRSYDICVPAQLVIDIIFVYLKCTLRFTSGKKFEKAYVFSVHIYISKGF